MDNEKNDVGIPEKPGIRDFIERVRQNPEENITISVDPREFPDHPDHYGASISPVPMEESNGKLDGIKSVGNEVVDRTKEMYPVLSEIITEYKLSFESFQDPAQIEAFLEYLSKIDGSQLSPEERMGKLLEDPVGRGLIVAELSGKADYVAKFLGVDLAKKVGGIMEGTLDLVRGFKKIKDSISSNDEKDQESGKNNKGELSKTQRSARNASFAFVNTGNSSGKTGVVIARDVRFTYIAVNGLARRMKEKFRSR